MLTTPLTRPASRSLPHDPKSCGASPKYQRVSWLAPALRVSSFPHVSYDLHPGVVAFLRSFATAMSTAMPIVFDQRNEYERPMNW